MIASRKVEREFTKGQPLSYDGIMDYGQLKRHTAGKVEWPEECEEP